MTKSKSKKRKLAHANSHNNNNSSNKIQKSSGSQALTHDEIWDDSALLRAWDEAAAEYEFYHSIHARGEDVEEVLRQYHATNGNGDGNEALEDNGEVLDDEEEGELAEDGEVDEGEIEGDGAERSTGEEHGPARPENDSTNTTVPVAFQQIPPEPGQPLTTNSTILPAPTQTQSQPQLPPDFQHSTLENIKMAYYWAGYYSGLYDAQQQALSNPQTQPPAQPTTSDVREAKSVPTAKSEDGEV